MQITEFVRIVNILRKMFPNKDIKFSRYMNGEKVTKVTHTNPNFKGNFKLMKIYVFDYYINTDKKYLTMKSFYEKRGITFSYQHPVRYKSL